MNGKEFKVCPDNWIHAPCSKQLCLANGVDLEMTVVGGRQSMNKIIKRETKSDDQSKEFLEK
jgi:hypothetical protein